jgi:hypothetical protein
LIFLFDFILFVINALQATQQTLRSVSLLALAPLHWRR